MAKFKLYYGFRGSIECDAKDYDEAYKYFDKLSTKELLEMLDCEYLDEYEVEEE